jgi:poly-gamma-glutamate synthesis protein (capsule biosynthesis protein)
MAPLTIGLAGDVMLGRTLDTIISQRGYDYPWGDILPVMRNTDLNIVNLETTLTHNSRKVYKTFNFKASPDKVQSLVSANIGVVNLANNHILDFKMEGLLETIQTLDKSGINHVGAGKKIEEALKAIVIRKKGVRIGVLGMTDNEPGWMANGGAGTNYINIADNEARIRILHSIENLRKEADMIIVSIHWGPNMKERPSPEFISFAHAMADHGASVIHGHSAHIFQGVECYSNSLILYDTGDFVDDYVVDPDLRNDLSAFFILTISKSGLLNARFVPVRISQYQVNLARESDYVWVIKQMQQLSAVFNTQIDEDEGFISTPHDPNHR